MKFRNNKHLIRISNNQLETMNEENKNTNLTY